jgi:hypothetical protein
MIAVSNQAQPPHIYHFLPQTWGLIQKYQANNDIDDFIVY